MTPALCDKSPGLTGIIANVTNSCELLWRNQMHGMRKKPQISYRIGYLLNRE